MKIYICAGSGEAEMEMNAFDKALLNAGIGNYNLIYLSSVIPANAEISEEKFPRKKSDHGNKLFVVIAKAFQKKKEKKAVAGIGWMTKKDNSGEGIFAEYTGESRKEVEERIKKTLEEMHFVRKEEFGHEYEEMHFKIKETECTGKGKTACAIVAAVYKSEEWK